MKRRTLWIAAGSLAVATVGGVLLANKSAVRPPQRVALIGDSYAVGLGPKLAAYFPDFKYEGHVGTNTWQWAAGNYGSWLAAFKPDVVLVSLGVNDGSSPNLANYQKIVQWLHGIGARVVWIMPPANVSTPSSEIIVSLGVPVIPATETPLSSDGLHPRSYDQWAAEIARNLA